MGKASAYGTYYVRKSDGTTYTPNNVYLRYANGTTKLLWSNAKPFYLAFANYPISITASNGSTPECTTDSTGYFISAKKKTGATSYGYCTAQSTAIPTQKCNKVRISYTLNQHIQEASINGVDVTANKNGSGTLTLDVSGDTFTIGMHLVNATDSEYGTMKITEVYFYKA